MVDNRACFGNECVARGGVQSYDIFLFSLFKRLYLLPFFLAFDGDHCLGICWISHSVF